MIDTSSSVNSSASSERKKAALRYLSEEVRAAHYEGDGVLVNHICAVALERIREWVKDGLSEIRVSDIHWALVMPLYWLVDDYMLFPIRDVIDKVKPNDEKEEKLIKVLKHAFYMIEQSLDDADKVIEELKILEPIWAEQRNECEDSALLALTIELVWWRNPISHPDQYFRDVGVDLSE